MIFFAAGDNLIESREQLIVGKMGVSRMVSFYVVTEEQLDILISCQKKFQKQLKDK
jgi:hypothetical protein